MEISVHPSHIASYKKYLEVLRLTETFLDKEGFLKADLPVLSPALVPESYLEIFKTDYIYFSKRKSLYLTPSPELFLKRLLAYGIGNCYYLGHAFRNSEQPSDKHSMEFTMLEVYKTNAQYLDIAELILELFRHIAVGLFGKSTIRYQNYKISFDRWERLTVAKAFQDFAGISEEALFDETAFIQRAKEKKYRTKGFTYEDIFSQIYVQEIEPNLGIHGFPTLLYDYPKEFAALAKLNPDGRTAQRFECYIGGVEIGDCYTELTDWNEQEKRFEMENAKRKKLRLINHPVDKGFIQALQYGLVPCSGVAIGFERLAMIYTGKTSIHDLKLITIQ